MSVRFGSRLSGASMFGRVLLSYVIVVRDCTSFGLPAHVRIARDCLRSAPHYSTPVDAWSRVCRPQPITLTRDIATSGLLSSKPECLRSECLSGSPASARLGVGRRTPRRRPDWLSGCRRRVGAQSRPIVADLISAELGEGDVVACHSSADERNDLLTVRG